MPRHCENAVKMAQCLQGHEKVAWVNCPSLPGSKDYDLVQKYMPDGTCGVITFGLKGGREAAVKMMDKLKLVAIVTHVADARSMRTSSCKSYTQTDEAGTVWKS